MSRYFVYNKDFDSNIVTFNNDNIYIEDAFNTDDDVSSDDGEEDYDEHELEYLLEEPPDIYSNDHPWDTRKVSYRNRPEIWMLNVCL